MLIAIGSEIFENNKTTENLSSFTAQTMKFSIKDFFCKCDQIRIFLRIWSHLPKKSLMKNFIFCAVSIKLTQKKVWDHKFRITIALNGNLSYLQTIWNFTKKLLWKLFSVVYTVTHDLLDNLTLSWRSPYRIETTLKINWLVSIS